MRIFPASVRRLCAVLSICAGACGILLAPSVGLFGGKELRSYSLSRSTEHSWGTAITSLDFELPAIHNQRGLIFMNVFLAGSLVAIFGGVYGLSAPRRPL
jgi:hypothetical protein